MRSIENVHEIDAASEKQGALMVPVMLRPVFLREAKGRRTSEADIPPATTEKHLINSVFVGKGDNLGIIAELHRHANVDVFCGSLACVHKTKASHSFFGDEPHSGKGEIRAELMPAVFFPAFGEASRLFPEGQSGKGQKASKNAGPSDGGIPPWYLAFLFAVGGIAGYVMSRPDK
jgi:hypothetical protein